MKKRVLRLFAALLILFLLFTAVACGGQNGVSVPSSEPASAQEPASSPEPASVPESGQEETPDDAVSPLLWRVTDGQGHTLYLIGTIHIGDRRSDAVLDRLAPVLDSCDALAVEFDAVAYTGNVQRITEDMQQYLLTDGSVITDHLPKTLYRRACMLLEQAGMYPSLFVQYNAAWWAQLIESAMTMVYTKLDTNKAMDSLLIRYAYRHDIPVLEVESAAFQMELLNSFDEALYLLLIEETLQNVKLFRSQLDEMYTLWLAGDQDAFWTYLAGENEGTGDYTPEQTALLEDYNRRLLDERNLGMRERAVEYLAGGQTVFFAVGSAHMALDTGLVQLLMDAGYTVEQMAY